MKNTDKLFDGGTAFPRSLGSYPIDPNDLHAVSWERQAQGMSLRDWYAGLALQGMVAGCPWGVNDLKDPSLDIAARDVSSVCFKLADAMIKERDSEAD